MLKLRRRGPDRGALGRPFVASALSEHRWDAKPLESDAGRRLLEQPDEVIVSAIFEALDRARPRGGLVDDRSLAAQGLATQLARRKLAYTTEDVDALLRRALDEDVTWLRGDRLRVAVTAAEYFVREHGLTPIEKELRRARAWAERERDELYTGERTAVAKRLRKLLETEPPTEVDVALLGDDAWGKEARRILEPRSKHAPTAAVLAHAASLTQARPSKKWREKAAELADEEVVLPLLEQALATGDGPVRWGVPQWVSHKSATMLRGLVHTAAAARYAWMPDLAGRLALHAGQTVGSVGEVRDQTVANACIRALGDVGGDEAVGHLSVLRERIKHRAVLKQVEKALGEAAAAAGITKGELLERQVPTFDLDADGRREVQLGDTTVVLELGELRPRSLPKRVREEHADELRALRAHAKEIKKRLAVERVRVESLFAEARRWPADDWRRHYRDHPLVGAIARPLIWRFVADGRSEVTLGADAPDWADEVELWHPIGAEPEEVQSWRRFLLEHELTQPFKQVFREVYIVAPAELETGTYSNRFAAHILRYPQAYALIKQRGWGITALGPYDNDGGRQWRDFEHFGIRAHFWLDHTGDDYDLIDAYAATDQVRFTRIGDDEPLPLADVPRIVFSETMRDVDLFVAVTSIAGDPEWVDRGEDRFVDYWREASFGELAGSAATRREVLADLVPQLAIAGRCTLTDRYLVVRGDRQTYKIHLGSGNVLMEPDDQYLCIVPARPKQKLYLPFPEDDRLAVILSKAFLLARDAKIDDRTITAQIERR
jgi:hypothetical protein